MKTKTNSNKGLIASVILLGIVVIAVGTYFKVSRWNDRDGFRGGCPFAKQLDQKSWSKYDGAKYGFQYPAGYTVKPATSEYKVLTVMRGDAKVLELFRNSDFPGGDRPIGIVGDEPLTQKEADEIIPKETFDIMGDNTKYEVRLFYSNADPALKSTVRLIANSIKLK